MSNSRINQIVTLLYAHKKIVTSTGVHDKAINNLSKLKNRMMRNIEYYDNNELIKSNIEFLVKVIDIFIE
jgi:hypothetical protein